MTPVGSLELELTPDPEGHLIAATAFGTLGYFLYNTEQRQ
jgi:hypothetical protein